MSDRPPHPDELVSAYLDGELTPAEAAAVQADETLAARAEELRAVRDAVAAPVSAPSAERRDQMIAAAIDAVSDVTVPSGVVVPLHRSVQPLLAAAAAVVAIAVVVGAGLLASRLGGGDDADMTASPGTTASDDPADFDMSESADGADAVAAPEPAAADEKPMADEESAYDDAMDEESIAEEESAYDDAMDEKSMAEEESMADMLAAPEGLDMAAAQAAVAQAEAEAGGRFSCCG